MSEKRTGGKKANRVTAAVIETALKVIFYTVAVMLFFACAKKAYAFGYEVFNQEAMAEAPGVDKTFVVEEGMGDQACMEALEQSGLIRNALTARIQKLFFGFEIYPGTYTLNTSMTTKEILEILDEKPPEETTAPETTAAPATDADASVGETKEIIEEGD